MNPEPMSAERQQLATIVFTDLIGFTEYTEACGDDAALRLLDDQSEIASRCLADGVGRVVKELGDGLMLWFGEPMHALRTAHAILVTAIDAREQQRFPLALRIGMHCGGVTARGDDYIGRTVNIAARIADLAGPSELLASEPIVEAAAAARADVRFDAVGPTRIKGVGEPVWLYRLATAR